ncbi:MAG: acetylxylan esterase [Chloroflexota bacterium]|nr:acetylxylan esterase [Chloroflexota bacterium]
MNGMNAAGERTGLGPADIAVLGSGFPTLHDPRLREVRHSDETYTLPAYASRAAWLTRAAQLRRRILVTAGLWPEPPRTPLRAKVWGRLERDGYTVEKVAFQSSPGFYVTGNLYRPRAQASGQRYPAVLNPHGHWPQGRLAEEARGSVPARCITFARQGFVAFSYDMVGYLDSRQVDHRTFGGWREWLWGIHSLGLQLWNSIRSLDFLTELPDVDPARLACTGASGGGTQTFLLTAVDDRVQVAAPVNMISAHMQGGCVCENAPGLRLDTFNVEIAALTAPRPLLLVSATGDWTAHTPTVEFPAIQSIYRLFGAEDRVESVQIDAGHNYNRASREAVYAFFARWLGGAPAGTRVPEEPYPVEQDADLRVFPDGEPLPADALDTAGITTALVRQARTAVRDRWPRDTRQVEQLRAQFGAAFADVLAAGSPQPEALAIERRTSEQLTSIEGIAYRLERLLIGRQADGGTPATTFPALHLTPMGRAASGTQPPVLLVHGAGKAASFRQEGETVQLGQLAATLLGAGRPVLTCDVFLTGEYLSPLGNTGRPVLEAHFTTFNRTDAQWHVYDVVTAVAALRQLAGAAAVDLVGAGDAGLWCLLARAIAGESIRKLAVEMTDFGWDRDEHYRDRLYIPGLRRLGDMPTAVALAAPASLLLHGATDGSVSPPLTRRLHRLYAALGRPAALTTRQDTADAAELCAWLMADS